MFAGTAYTYRYVKTNFSGYYSSENMHLEPNSFSPYYSFINNGWNQCFIDSEYSMGKKYDQVNRRKLAGIGIWALGYDDGYSELWELIGEKFTASATPINADTIFDTGGPAFDYYNNENYTYTITTLENTHPYLSFSYLNTEKGYDTLWIYDGSDTINSLIGEFSGDSIPILITASGNTLTFRFQSDNGITQTGWRAVYDTLPVSSVNESELKSDIVIFPNPATNKFVILAPGLINQCRKTTELKIQIFNNSGQIINNFSIPLNNHSIIIDSKGWKSGPYCVYLSCNGTIIGRKKLILK